MLAQQLSVLGEEIRYLRQIKPGFISEKVEAGALVKLDNQILYIVAGIGKIPPPGKWQCMSRN